ncbi:type II toxin-antitoxin system RelE/ParE family toxin [Desulfovibrio aminophilus]|nr:type II toxin-antitoxin system RelE/ParE family toxin [Desulfovibrio aminophilus]MCM0756101.1 type II toxin-antitoxin system RelE/ParE family toxin [Desulfovibrio aminophilus]
MITSFRCKDTEALFRREQVRRLPADILRVAYRKLQMLQAADSLDDLRNPPGNRLEPLKGDRAGQYSIRLNDRWRVCFVWRDGGAHEVEIVDYH